MKQEQQDALRAPFSKEKIQKLPTGGLQLDYVSHAWVTDRLLEVDPTWTWEPVAFDQSGLPKFDENGGLWIKLTVCGVTRYGYGEPQGRDKFDLKVVPLIQGGEFTDAEKRNLRLIFDNKKAELES